MSYPIILRVCLVLLVLFVAPAAAQDNGPTSKNIELLAQFNPGLESGFDYNDIWGYAAGGREYAIMGAVNGVWFIDVTDPRNPVTVDFVAGPHSTWRDIKTHEQYAYVVHDAIRPSSELKTGLYIIDMSGLPEKVELVGIFDQEMKNGTAHNLYIDSGVAYLAGSNPHEMLITMNLVNPREPQILNVFSDVYWHDVVVNKNMIFGSAIRNGFYAATTNVPGQIDDMQQFELPDVYLHNIWMTDDNNFIAISEEHHGAAMRFWDISDLDNPEEVLKYVIDDVAVPHNAHIRGDYAYVSYYFDGLKIFDLHNRRAPSEVAYYDTYPWTNPGQRVVNPVLDNPFEGAWGVYPDLPSGNILVSDISAGLLVLEFNNSRVGYVRGVIRDSLTNKVIPNVTVKTVDSRTGSKSTFISSAVDGSFVGSHRDSKHVLRFDKPGYESVKYELEGLAAGGETIIDVNMLSNIAGPVALMVVDKFNQPVPGVELLVRSLQRDIKFKKTTDNTGFVYRQLLLGEYVASVSHWGYILPDTTFVVDSEELTVIRFPAVAGYHHKFNPGNDWKLGTNSNAGEKWKHRKGADQRRNTVLPDADYRGQQAGYFAEAVAQLGTASLQTPAFSLIELDNPILQFRVWYNAPRYGKHANADDTLQVWLGNGDEWTLIDQYTDVQDSVWRQMRYNIGDLVTSTENMHVRFDLVEGDRNNKNDKSIRSFVYAAIDEIIIAPADLNVISSVETTNEPNLQVELFSLRPNPANSFIEIVPAAALGQSGLCEIIDVRGRKVVDLAFDALDSAPLRADVAGLPPGAYYVRMTLEDGRMQDVQALQISR